MKKLVLAWFVVGLVGCGGDRSGGSGREAIMGGHPTSHWIQQLKSDDPDLRKSAKRILTEYGLKDNSVWNELMEAIKGSDRDLRIGVAEVFGAMGWDAKDALTVLNSMLRDPDERIARAAAYAMVRIDPDEAAKAGVPRSVLKQIKDD